MSIKEKRKRRKDYGIYHDEHEIEEMKFRPNLYKQHTRREKLYRHLYRLGSKDDNYIRELDIKGMDRRLTEEMALSSWL